MREPKFEGTFRKCTLALRKLGMDFFLSSDKSKTSHYRVRTLLHHVLLRTDEPKKSGPWFGIHSRYSFQDDLVLWFSLKSIHLRGVSHCVCTLLWFGSRTPFLALILDLARPILINSVMSKRVCKDMIKKCFFLKISLCQAPHLLFWVYIFSNLNFFLGFQHHINFFWAYSYLLTVCDFFSTLGVFFSCSNWWFMMLFPLL